MNFDISAFGRRLKALRESQCLSQVQMAMALSISPQYLSNIENGKRKASVELLVHMADHFNISLDMLILGVSNHADYQREMKNELALSLKHLEKVDQLLNELR